MKNFISRTLPKRIIILSKALKYLSYAGIIIFPLFNLVYWFLDIHKVKFIVNNFYLQFSDAPELDLSHLPVKMKFLGFLIDLVPCTLFVAILIFLVKLAKQYEYLYFFSKKNVQYVRAIAFLIFCQIVVFPFYSLLRAYVFTPESENTVVNLFGPYDFKVVIILFCVLLIAYIKEAASLLEKDLAGTI